MRVWTHGVGNWPVGRGAAPVENQAMGREACREAIPVVVLIRFNLWYVTNGSLRDYSMFEILVGLQGLVPHLQKGRPDMIPTSGNGLSPQRVHKDNHRELLHCSEHEYVDW
ncbi:unnamed protein product [Thelazia callipaeda]|uniref:Uncharacterized protein n=1 Tax=Thelazia callipaeda TaxID=103827 RepID=A0A0N5DBC2_THECL|nr:unnamed protein product [Thelazia callipaeda]